jgi:hypothetical protein
MPVVIHNGSDCSLKKINPFDLRPEDWKIANEKEPSLPLPPSGKLQEDHP